MITRVKLLGLRELQLKISNASKVLSHSKPLMNQIGAYVELQILKRTAKGIDADGSPFIPYSKPYKKVREAAGRPTNIVDLFFTGAMASALTFDADNNKVKLFFMNTSDKYGIRNPDKAYWNQQTRNFFSLSMKDIIAVEKMAKSYVAKAVKK